MERTNISKSAFLRLPAELRNHIYGLIFQGYALHVINTKEVQYPTPLTRLWRTLCCNHAQDSSTAAIIRRSEEFDPSYQYDRRHETCFRKAAVGQTFNDILGILTVCRQIHAEAASIPYAHTVFHFDYINDIALFASALPDAQRMAVRSINLFFDRRPDPDFRTGPSIKSLSGVRELMVFGLMDEYALISSALTSLNGEDPRDKYIKGVLAFKDHPLETVSVSMYPKQHKSNPRPLVLQAQTRQTVKELRVWSMEIERKLLELKQEEQSSKQGKRKIRRGDSYAKRQRLE